MKVDIADGSVVGYSSNSGRGEQSDEVQITITTDEEALKVMLQIHDCFTLRRLEPDGERKAELAEAMLDLLGLLREWALTRTFPS